MIIGNLLTFFSEKFGSQKIDEEVIQKFEKVTGKKGTYFNVKTYLEIHTLILTHHYLKCVYLQHTTSYDEAYSSLTETSTISSICMKMAKSSTCTQVEGLPPRACISDT